MLGQFIGMPGPIELMILGMLGLPVVIVAYLWFSGRFKSGGAGMPCPRCQVWTVPGANYCHQCGQPMQEPPERRSQQP